MMRYVQNRSTLNRSKGGPQKNFTWFWILLTVVLTVAVVLGYIFLFQPNEEEEEGEVATTELESELATAEILTSPEVAAVAEEVVEETQIEQVELVYLGEEEGAFGGIAKRGYSGDLFTHVVVADLPALGANEFYEGWLVKPGVVQFFSTGEMFARADGRFGLVWEVELSDAPDDLAEHSEVVITLEERDGNPAPSAIHVLEGEF